MGLDMFLVVQVRVTTPEAQETIAAALGDTGLADSVRVVALEVGYWRKANAIHKWFVDNVQDGEDNCAEYFVDEYQLDALHDIVQEVLNNPEKAQELLPPQAGFFFGGTDIDDNYFDDLRHTLEILKKVKDIVGDTKQVWGGAYYSSSW